MAGSAASPGAKAPQTSRCCCNGIHRRSIPRPSLISRSSSLGSGSDVFLFACSCHIIAPRESCMDEVTGAGQQSCRAEASNITENAATEVGTAVEFARCFLRLANLPNFALDRLSRYKQPFGIKPARSCWPWMLWTAGSHKKEYVVYAMAKMLVIKTTHQRCEYATACPRCVAATVTAFALAPAAWRYSPR